LGIGNTSSWSTYAVQVFGLGSGVTGITPGGTWVCAGLTDGMACWGRGYFGNTGPDKIVSYVPIWVELL
jgi:hypothetical protein